jgi:hypothetical protein
MTLFAKVLGFRFHSGVFCAVLAIALSFAPIALAQTGDGAPAQQLYLISGTPFPMGIRGGDPRDPLPATLYRAKSDRTLEPIREIFPPTDILNVALSSETAVFLVHRSSERTTVSIVHTQNPTLVDDVVCEASGLRPLSDFTAIADLGGQTGRSLRRKRR